MLTAEMIIAVAPVIGLAFYCLLHVIACRFSGGRGPYGPLIGSFFPGMLIAVGVTAWAAWQLRSPGIDIAGAVVLNATTYGALGWGYFHFVNMNVASLRMRLLYELAEAGGKLPRTELLARYDSQRTIAIRIERLVGGGHLVQRDGLYYSGKPHFLYAARFFNALRHLILGRHASIAGPASVPVEEQTTEVHP